MLYGSVREVRSGLKKRLTRCFPGAKPICMSDLYLITTENVQVFFRTFWVEFSPTASTVVSLSCDGPYVESCLLECDPFPLVLLTVEYLEGVLCLIVVPFDSMIPATLLVLLPVEVDADPLENISSFASPLSPFPFV